MLDNVNDYIEHGLTHQIHTSERMSRRGCRRRWDWIFHDMYYPYITAKPLEFGVAYHKGMETLYDPINNADGTTNTAYQLARVAFRRKCEEQKAHFVSHHPEQYTPEVDQDYKERVELGLGMLNYWHTYIMPKYDHGFTPVKVEIAFEVPILSPQHEPLWCKCDQCWRRWVNSEEGAEHHDLWQQDFGKKLYELTHDQVMKYTADRGYYKQEHWKGLPVTYGGRIDLLVQDTNGDYWIVDWKTTVRMTKAEANVADEFLLLDDQITSYCWALRMIGIRVRGFIYVEIKKAFPQQPEPNKIQRLGRWFSVSKQQNTTYEIYRQTVEENDTGAYLAGLYDEFLSYLRDQEAADPLVHRHQIIRNDTELDNAGYNIWAEAREMVDPSIINYPSPGRFACNFCAFREPCIAKNRGEDYQYALDTLYDKRTTHYWESAEPTTDKRYSY